jgi:hypothetical protein
LVRSGFRNIYPNQSVSARLLSLVSDYPTYREVGEIGPNIRINQ